jgi:hypothetical protein
MTRILVTDLFADGPMINGYICMLSLSTQSNNQAALEQGTSKLMLASLM